MKTRISSSTFPVVTVTENSRESRCQEITPSLGRQAAAFPLQSPPSFPPTYPHSCVTSGMEDVGIQELKVANVQPLILRAPQISIANPYPIRSKPTPSLSTHKSLNPEPKTPFNQSSNEGPVAWFPPALLFSISLFSKTPLSRMVTPRSSILPLPLFKDNPQLVLPMGNSPQSPQSSSSTCWHSQ